MFQRCFKLIYCCIHCCIQQQKDAAQHTAKQSLAEYGISRSPVHYRTRHIGRIPVGESFIVKKLLFRFQIRDAGIYFLLEFCS